MSEKTEEASSQKIREARESGEVAKSTDLISVVQCLTIFLFMLSRGRNVLASIYTLIKTTIDAINLPLDRAFERIANASYLLLLPILELGGALVIVTLVAAIGQTGFLVTPRALLPKWEKLNIASNAKEMFSSRTVIQFLKNFVKISLIGLATFLIIKAHLPDLQFVPTYALFCGFALLLVLLRSVFLAALAIMVVISIADFAYERHSYFKRLRMSKEDKKEEAKKNEGDPEIKRERRKLHQSIQSGSLAGKIKKTSVVIRNPTHFAICLRYDPQSVPVPKVLEKGRDSAASRIVSLAESLGIPIIEDITLARALFKEVAVDEVIPHSLFAPVAAILRSIEDEKIWL
jgi:type III secretion protein U